MDEVQTGILKWKRLWLQQSVDKLLRRIAKHFPQECINSDSA